VAAEHARELAAAHEATQAIQRQYDVLREAYTTLERGLEAAQMRHEHALRAAQSQHVQKQQHEMEEQWLAKMANIKTELEAKHAADTQVGGFFG
jgi:chromosome segregation ATPase